MTDVMINPARAVDLTEEQASESSAAETPLFDESDDSENRATFEYIPLQSSSNSIWLVVLEPHGGNDDSEIRCKITHTTFGAKPMHEALSYTWGDETLKKSIKQDGCLFAVSNNLYEAVSHLRNPKIERKLWIDATSINQMDIDEKSSQIRAMPFIYKRARAVVVWLGASLGYPNGSSYWQRVWVIQEFGKARKLEICWGPSHWASDDGHGPLILFPYTWEDFLLYLGRTDLQVYLRPTYGDAMSHPQKVSEWEQAVDHRVSHDQPEYKREQSDLFLETLEETNEEFLTGRLSLTQTNSGAQENGADTGFMEFRQRHNADVPEYENRQAPSLFLVQDRNYASPLTPMGIACESAEPEDLMFQVPNHDLVFVVRVSGHIMKLIGFAGIAMTAEQWKDRKTRQKIGQNGGTLFNVPDSNLLTDLNVCLDLATLYKMSD